MNEIKIPSRMDQLKADLDHSQRRLSLFRQIRDDASNDCQEELGRLNFIKQQIYAEEMEQRKCLQKSAE